jgi:hypothetical protein
MAKYLSSIIPHWAWGDSFVVLTHDTRNNSVELALTFGCKSHPMSCAGEYAPRTWSHNNRTWDALPNLWFCWWHYFEIIFLNIPIFISWLLSNKKLNIQNDLGSSNRTGPSSVYYICHCRLIQNLIPFIANVPISFYIRDILLNTGIYDTVFSALMILLALYFYLQFPDILFLTFALQTQGIVNQFSFAKQIE